MLTNLKKLQDSTRSYNQEDFFGGFVLLHALNLPACCCRVFGPTVTVARQLESLSSVGTVCASIDTVKCDLSFWAEAELKSLQPSQIWLTLVSCRLCSAGEPST